MKKGSSENVQSTRPPLNVIKSSPCVHELGFQGRMQANVGPRYIFVCFTPAGLSFHCLLPMHGMPKHKGPMGAIPHRTTCQGLGDCLSPLTCLDYFSSRKLPRYRSLISRRGFPHDHLPPVLLPLGEAFLSASTRFLHYGYFYCSPR